jgi:hypothetical protein
MPHDSKGQPYPGGAYTYPELAAAGLWTTPSDLARFILGVQRNADAKGQALLSPAMMRTMLEPVKNGYALGLDIEGKGSTLAFAHGGSNRGFQNALYAYVEHGDGIVVMTNGDNGPALAQGILRAAAFEYRWPSSQTVMRKTVALSPQQRKALAGVYEIKGMGSFELREQDGQLVLLAHGDPAEPVYAASPTVLFVLSRELELHMAEDGSQGGRLTSGAFDVPFARTGNAAAH